MGATLGHVMIVGCALPASMKAALSAAAGLAIDGRCRWWSVEFVPPNDGGIRLGQAALAVEEDGAGR